VTADASDKIATKSRIWAADIRATMAAADSDAPAATRQAEDPAAPVAGDPKAPDAPEVAEVADAAADPSDGSTPA
jgi:hypothetical protein